MKKLLWRWLAGEVAAGGALSLWIGWNYGFWAIFPLALTVIVMAFTTYIFILAAPQLHRAESMGEDYMSDSTYT